jgi:hypothetical protein
MKTTLFVPRLPAEAARRNRPGPPRRGLEGTPVMHCKLKWPAVVSCLLFFVSPAAAQVIVTPREPSPTATPQLPADSIPVVITYGEGTETRVQITRGIMEPVGVPPNQPVTVTLYLASGIPGSPVQVGLFDGGQISPAVSPGVSVPNPPPVNSVIETDAILVLADGSVRFNFQSGLTLGLYRTLVVIGSKQYLLQFYAVRPRALPTPPAEITISPPPGPSPPNTPPPG